MQINWFELSNIGKQTVKMPKDASILCVQDYNHSGILVLYAEVNPDAPLQDRTIEMFRNGEEMHCDMGVHRRYIGSCNYFHIYERID